MERKMVLRYYRLKSRGVYVLMWGYEDEPYDPPPPGAALREWCNKDR